MLIRTHIGVSLDGFVATPDGLPTWDTIPTFVPKESHGLPELNEQCDAVVVGGTSFDQGFKDWVAGGWPWPDKKVFVLTSRRLPKDVPAGVIASKGGPAGLVKQLREAGFARDAHVLGGPRVIQAFLQLGALDRLGMVVLPVLLGKGIPLFPIETTTFSHDAWRASQAAPSAAGPRPLLRLERQRTFPDGAVELLYSPT